MSTLICTESDRRIKKVEKNKTENKRACYNVCIKVGMPEALLSCLLLPPSFCSEPDKTFMIQSDILPLGYWSLNAYSHEYNIDLPVEFC